jgi:hypothetical protein
VTKVFPTIMIVLSVAASIVYAMKGVAEWRMAVYWAAAATLNYVVTW